LSITGGIPGIRFRNCGATYVAFVVIAGLDEGDGVEGRVEAAGVVRWWRPHSVRARTPTARNAAAGRADRFQNTRTLLRLSNRATAHAIGRT
jgi:hypothetical protein